MNSFSKSLLIGLLPCAAVSAQGLYSIAPNDDEADSSLPLTYIVGGGVGYDSNPTPLFGGGGNSGSVTLNAFAQANVTNVTPQTTWDFYTRIGLRFFLTDLDGDNADQVNYEARVGVNFTHRFSERLRFSSRNFVAYEIEPDFEYSFANDRRAGQFFRYSSENSVGYRWTERLGTQTGVNFNGIIFEDLDNSDFNSITFRHQFRYRVSPATVLTAGYRYRTTFGPNSGLDSGSHFLVGGVEHRINPVSAIVLRGGAQINDPDNGGTSASPFVEGTLRSQLTPQLSANIFARWSSEEFNRSLVSEGNFFEFEESQTLRIGSRFNYTVSPAVSLFGGINYVFTDFEDQTAPGVGLGSDSDEGVLNINVGASYRLTDNLYLTGSYNYTESFSDFDDREYERNRFNLGVQATF